MTGLLGRVRCALDILRGAAPAPGPLPTRLVTPPLQSADGAAARQEAALRMMDEDCRGFLLFTFHDGEAEGAERELRMASFVGPDWWPPLVYTLEEIAYARRGYERFQGG